MFSFPRMSSETIINMFMLCAWRMEGMVHDIFVVHRTQKGHFDIQIGD
jgi:hypothetical protein